MSEAVLIHPTAIVSTDAEIGAGVRVGPCAVIEPGAKIGDGSRIEAFAHIYGSVSMGKNCHIFEYTSIGSDPQDHDFGSERTFVRIGDDVLIRENVSIHRATGEGNETVVGSGTWLMEGCHVAHNVILGEHCVVTNKAGFSGHVHVDHHAVIGGLSGFHQFVKVGAYAMVGGMAKIIKDVPPYSMVDGNPARVRGLNIVGLRRNGFTQEQRTRIKAVYKFLYSGEIGRREAIAALEERFPGDEFAAEIALFARSLKRGLTRWYRGRGDKSGGLE
ncbi:acyl-[acyl-carrier-protein]--UDP-N-acetylglucosamine O-acyltransferase [Synergistales bacterium]|nr:acyl-[acyl-carrier-protein]--UDP-N-acetylglucosamine O-acyltransferase [Synergistales bacterium]